ncbi:Monooxygenase 2 [Vitis vinifera]|uniref:Monooxygenase 2 n=1 Tax=Vitis vinifera TaxID=29760 RepID=A0A438CNI1_VITVI|nr:Monooxygenase 2 [Vitis vinifera]
MEKMVLEEEIVIVGAGIAGLATAIALKRVGIRALVLERSDGLRVSGAALTLAPNAWLALDALGVAHKLTPLYAVREKMCITNVATGVVQEVSLIRNNSPLDDHRDSKWICNDLIGCQISSRGGPITVHRKTLLENLAEELPRHSIRFSSKPISIEAQAQEGPYTIRLEDGTVITTKVLIGCDGVNSFVARKLGLAEPVNSGRSSVVALAVFPEGHAVRETMTKDPQEIQEQVIENYAKDFPPIYAEVVRHCDLSTLTLAPLRLRLPWDVIFGNVSKGNMTVVGDAMHPMTPDLGQGGCAALEDAVVLGRHIGKSFIDNGRLVPGAVAEAIEGYVKERRWRAAWLIAGSYFSGWAQVGREGWLMKMFRDMIFYRFVLKRLISIADYDCGKLPLLDDQNKTH